jgi:hypothetical protein
MRPTTWRVRVKQAVEGWVEVEAFNPAQAELEAAKKPGVISVLGNAIRGDDVVAPPPPAGARDD